MRVLKYFALYCAILGGALAVAAVVAHVLIAREYRLNVTEQLTILAHNGEEAVERNPPGAPLRPALSRAFDAPDEGLAWIDLRGRTILRGTRSTRT